jgi:hypothetical protein
MVHPGLDDIKGGALQQLPQAEQPTESNSAPRHAKAMDLDAGALEHGAVLPLIHKGYYYVFVLFIMGTESIEHGFGTAIAQTGNHVKNSHVQ